MPLTKSQGNMYDWVTHMHTQLGGKCEHECSYCHVQRKAKWLPNLRAKYSGPIRVIEKELAVRYGKERVIFVEHLNDLFAEGVPWEYVTQVIQHCLDFPDNVYIFQTKNPRRYSEFSVKIPSGSYLGTTIESNRAYIGMSKAPIAVHRAMGMAKLPPRFIRFVTIEPILDFDLDKMLELISVARPDFVNIGADSKGLKLPEPSLDKVLALISGLQEMGVAIKEKSNLDRLKGGRDV